MTPNSNHWQQQNVAGINCLVFEPSESHDHNYTLLYLGDDAGGNKMDDGPTAEDLRQRKLRVVMPQLTSTWAIDHPIPGSGTDQTLRATVMERLVPAMTEVFDVAPPRIALLGDGMGGQAALRISFEDPRTFPIVYAVRPKIDFHLLVRDGHPELTELYGDEETARQDTAILHVHPLHYPRFMFFCCDPLEYPWFDGADRLRMKMAASGIMHECELEESSESPAENYFRARLPDALQFLDRHLDRERLRLV